MAVKIRKAIRGLSDGDGEEDRVGIGVRDDILSDITTFYL